MRRWTVRMVIESNNHHQDEEPYYEDREMPRVIREWMDSALEDRDDQPEIKWSEFIRTVDHMVQKDGS